MIDEKKIDRKENLQDKSYEWDFEFIKNIWGKSIIFISVLMILYLGVLYLMKYNNWDMAKRGQFGDMFGGINAFFSGLGFMLLFYAVAMQVLQIRLQKRDLNIQRADLKLQREELKQTREEFITQNETLKKQRFENTFFHLIALHNEIVDNLYITKDEIIEEKPIPNAVHQTMVAKTYNKRDFFTKALSELGVDSMLGSFENPEDGWTVIKENYGVFNIEYAPHLSHYFRNLYHIYKYIHLSKLINEDEKKFYSSIIRAQLSDNELILIFYNMLIPDLGYPNFKFLDQNYDILKNLDFEWHLFNPSHSVIFNLAKVKTDPFVN